MTGAHIFQTEPGIIPKLWARFHKFNVNCLLFSQVSGGPSANKAWEDELEFFLDFYRADATMPFVQMLTLYRRAGKHMRMPRTSIGAVFMPTMDTIFHMKRV